MKINFPSLWKNDVSCKTCNDVVAIECQEYLLHCKEIMKYVDVPVNIKYRDIFGHVDKQLELVNIFRKIIRQRDVLLNCEL